MIFSNKRLGITLFLIIACAITAFAQNAETVATPGLTERGRNVAVTELNGTFYIAYNDDGGWLYFGKKENGSWDLDRVNSVPKAYVRDIEAYSDGNYTIVHISYDVNGSSNVVTSMNGGKTFSYSTPIDTGSSAGRTHIAVDKRDGTLYAVYHRHSGYWDYNFAYSNNHGRTFTVKKDFTQQYDSSSTGYDGKISMSNGVLATVYRDNNDSYTIKTGVSTNSGNSWSFGKIVDNMGNFATPDLTLVPGKRGTAYVSILGRTGLMVYKTDNLLAATPVWQRVFNNKQPVYNRDNGNYFSSISASPNGTVYLSYLDSDNKYKYRQSTDGGRSWSSEYTVGTSRGANLGRRPDSKPIANGFILGYYDENGNVSFYRHGSAGASEKSASGGSTQTSSFDSEERIYVPDSEDMIELEDIGDPFKVQLTETTLVLFSAPSSGRYVIESLSQNQRQLYISIYDINSDSDEPMTDNIHDNSLTPSIEASLQGGGYYMLGLGPMNNSDIGKNARLEVRKR